MASKIEFPADPSRHMRSVIRDGMVKPNGHPTQAKKRSVSLRRDPILTGDAGGES